VAWNTNLAGWLGRSSGRERELALTRDAWAASERARASSPLSKLADPDVAGALALEITKASWERAGHTLVEPLAVAVGQAVSDLLDAEAIGRITPLWDAIEEDVSIALEFREVVAHRARYATDFHRVHGTFSRQVLGALDTLYQALPATAFDTRAAADGSFDVPLLELLENPDELIQQFVALPFNDAAMGLGIFTDLRGALKRNLLVASGLSPDLETIDRPERIVYPLAQRGKSATELADLYLAGTPLRALLDVPVPFRIPEHVRFEHCHVLGGTGHGKTQLLQRMIYGDLVLAQRSRRSVVVIDSQGDLIERLSRLALFDPNAPHSLADRLILIDPADIEFPPALNLFDAHVDRLKEYRAVDRERVLNGVVETYDSFFGDILGAELTQKQGVVFKYLTRLMLAIPGATIHTLMRVMEDAEPYRSYMRALEGSARYFFEREFFEPSFAQTKRQILRRLWGVLSTPAFERMFAQRENKVDLFGAFGEGKIVLVNTAKDLLKEEGSSLLGRFFIGQIAQAALERATLSPEERTPVHVYVDEAQEYFDDRVETILAQARKYRVGLTIAHQTLDQLTPRLRASLHANTSIKLAGGTSSRDATALAHELHTSAAFIESMKRHKDTTEFALWIRNETPEAIRLRVPLGFLERQPVASASAMELVREQMRDRYCGTYDEVEAAIAEARGVGPSKQAPPPETSAPVAPTPRATSEPSRPVEDDEAIEPIETAPRSRTRKSAPEVGKGGPQHRYLQHLLKQLAEDRGLRVVIEEAVAGGQVDVGLHQGSLSVACEISVTSTPEYEAQNIAKCLQAGFGRVWAIAPDAKRRRAIQAKALDRLGAEATSKVEFFTPEEVVEALDALAVPEPINRVVKGYRVRSVRVAVSAEEAAQRRANIARVFSQRAGK
jgi:hypothetical protein